MSFLILVATSSLEHCVCVCGVVCVCVGGGGGGGGERAPQ